MAFFKNLKLDPNFEQWLDQRILSLKAEGVLESAGEEEVEELEKEEEFIWGEAPRVTTGESEYKNGPALTTHALYNDGMELSGKTAPDLNTNPDLDPDMDSKYKHHMSPEFSRDYYQFTWEDEEEADVFDKETYRVYKKDRHVPARDGPDVNQFNNSGEAGVSRNNGTKLERSYSEGSSHGDTYSIPENGQHRSSRLTQLGGLVLGIGQKDMEAGYTKLQSNKRRSQQSYNDSNANSRPKYLDYDPGLPDPRFSIAEDFEPNELPMLELRGVDSGNKRGRKSHEIQAGVTVHQEGEMTFSETGVAQGPDFGAHKGKHSNRILLPIDALEMDMSSDDDDILAADDFDVSSELAPDTQAIVTVDQATLVQQWQAKSQRTKIAIIAGIGGITLLVFALVALLVVELLKASW